MNPIGRRSVIRTLGAGIIGGSVLVGTASAKGQHYGNGNALDEFLNEEAEFKEDPVWDGEIADRRGMEVVDVAVGAMTSISAPDPNAPPEYPMAFDPKVVKVSPGATVRFTWASNPFQAPIPHDVTSLGDDDGDPVLKEHGNVRFHHHDQYIPATEENELEEDVNPTFEEEFTERGNHLYYCTPHGAPFTVEGPFGEVYNEFGMRGAVKVAGKPLSD